MHVTRSARSELHLHLVKLHYLMRTRRNEIARLCYKCFIKTCVTKSKVLSSPEANKRLEKMITMLRTKTSMDMTE